MIAESQRYCNLVPINLIHRTARDVQIHGYRIPKGTAITHQISTVMRDERYFENPDEFNPDRFLNKDGKFFSVPELMPFGIGKRSCLGEGLARMELFLFTTNIFNQFKITPTSKEKLSEKRIIGSTICPEPWTCNVEMRY